MVTPCILVLSLVSSHKFGTENKFMACEYFTGIFFIMEFFLELNIKFWPKK